jgi:hypothetical protein
MAPPSSGRRAGSGGHRLEAAVRALSIGPVNGLAENQKSGQPGDDPGAGSGVVNMAAIAQIITTFMVGLIAAYIAWRQWRTSHDRLILDLFERRFQVFQELTRTVSAAVNKPHPEINDLADFDQASEKARFLFGPEVRGYLGEVRRHLVNLITFGRALHEMDGPQRTNAEKMVTAALNEMSAFYARLADLVTRYLQMPVR